MRIAASIAAALSGLLIVVRALHGPLPWIYSPLNAEGIFALSVLLAMFVHAGGNSPANPRESFDWPGLASLAAMVAAAFAFSSHDYFLSDDFIMLRHARESAFTIRSYTTGGGDGFFRPLVYESFRLTWPWAGEDPFRWHLIGFVIHALNSMLVLLLARALGLGRFGAWFAGALFAIHATRPEAVLWITGRFDLLATLFVLVALVLFLHEYRWAALIALGAGLLCKESAYACPLLLLLLAPRRWRASIPFFAVAAALFLYRFWLFGSIGGYKTAIGRPQALTVGLVSVVKALALRLWAVLFFPVNWSIPSGVLLGIAMAAYIAAMLWLLIARGPGQRMVLAAVGFAILAALPPVQQLLIGADLQKARYIYLPSAGFCLLLATLVQQHRGAAALILAFNAVALFHNLTAWHDGAARVKATCAAVAAGKMDGAGLPNAVHGVYLFQNGLPECLQMAVRGK